VAFFAFRPRAVHLEAVVEVEERLGPVTIVDEPVERGQERDAVRDGVVGYVGMSLPTLLPEPDAERAEALLREGAIGVAQRDSLHVRVPALGQVPQPAAAGTSDDGDDATGVE